MTDSDHLARLIEIVAEAMEREPEARDAWLVEACTGDALLLEEARALVAGADRTSVSSVTRRLEAAVGSAAHEAGDVRQPDPERIGPYEIVRVLGRGGMGVVYLGRQHSPVRRDVAVKVLRRGMADGDSLRRFASEAQAMALMEHPNIARLFDAGETDDGRPFLAMELVDGLPITEYVEKRQLPLAARLRLFRSVCLAVQHAHQRGLIHRDLKPSNILVAAGDGGEAPKVIDFGIAKAVEGLLEAGGVETHHGSVLGTVDYMSPEQIRGVPGLVDVRSDVYSLGIVLYEMITGRHPFRRTTLREAGLIEAQRILLETEPARPSRSGDGEPTPGGARRDRRREELDWVVMKAIEKAPERRYQSAQDFAADIERYLAHEPLVARPPSLAYRTGKFVRRHRSGVIAASLVAVALLAGTTMAVRGSVVASAEARRAQAISDFLSDMLASVRPEESGREVTVREALDDARARLEAGEFSDDVDIDASLSHVIGYSYEGLGRYPDAIDLYERSAALRASAHGPDDDALFGTRYRLGTALWKRGDLEEALAIRLDLARTTEAIFGTEHWEHAESLSNLANTYADMGDLDRAEEYLRAAVAVGRRLDGPEGELHLARFLNNLGTVYDDLEAFASATEAFEESLGIRQRIEGEHDDVVVITLSNLAGAQASEGEFALAEGTYRRAISLGEDIYGPQHPRTASAYSGLATTLMHMGRFEEAEPYSRAAVAVRAATSGENWRVAQERAELAEILAATGRSSEAMAELQMAWDGLVRSGEETTRGAEIASSMADLLRQAGRTSEASDWDRRIATPSG